MYKLRLDFPLPLLDKSDVIRSFGPKVIWLQGKALLPRRHILYCTCTYTVVIVYVRIVLYVIVCTYIQYILGGGRARGKRGASASAHHQKLQLIIVSQFRALLSIHFSIYKYKCLAIDAKTAATRRYLPIVTRGVAS